MEFLNKEQHEKWMKEEFPKLQNSLYGFQGEEDIALKPYYTSKDGGIRIENFPVIDTTQSPNSSPSFRAILKLTYEEKPKTYSFTEEDQQVLGSLGSVDYQVIIIQVDKELKHLNHAHYLMTIRTSS